MQPKRKPQIFLYDYDRVNPVHKARFAELNREWLRKYFYVEPHDEETFSDPEGKILDKGGMILCAEVDGQIIGVGCLMPLHDGYFELAKMAVTEAYQGQGIGEQIVLELISRAKAITDRLYIVSNTSLEPAIKLYRRHGFVDSSEVRHGHYARGNITLELRF